MTRHPSPFESAPKALDPSVKEREQSAMEKKKAKGPRIAILTSGGDAPGMNACIRSVVRSAIYHDLEVLGVRHGYRGLIAGDLYPLGLRGVGNIIQRGGTILGSSRCPEFRDAAGRKKAAEVLKEQGLDALIVLGGDGSMQGAEQLSKEMKLTVVGVPCTIDNDIFGTDLSIGFDTAVETAVQCIDKIRDTADSHGRVFIVEVMGKETGHLALETGLAGGAEFVVIPEESFELKPLVTKIRAGFKRGKTGSIVVVAERKTPGIAISIAEDLQKEIQREVKAIILGHLQRGGSPTRLDRNLAAGFGHLAVELCMAGDSRYMTALVGQKLQKVSFSSVAGKKREIDREKLALIDRLSI